MTWDVFISVDGRDAEKVELLVEKLKLLRFRPFFYKDRGSMRGDAQFDVQIEPALRTVAAIVGIMSEHSKTNANVIDEWDYGREDRRFISVRFGPIEKLFSYRYNKFPAYDLSDFEGDWGHTEFRSLILLLAEKAKRAGVPDFLELCRREDANALSKWCEQFPGDALVPVCAEVYSEVVESSEGVGSQSLLTIWRDAISESVDPEEYSAWLALAKRGASRVAGTTMRSKRLVALTKQAEERLEQLREWETLSSTDDLEQLGFFQSKKPFPSLAAIVAHTLESAVRAGENRQAEEARRKAEADLAWSKAPADNSAALRRLRAMAGTPALLFPRIDDRIDELTTLGRTFQDAVDGVDPTLLPTMKVMPLGEVNYGEQERLGARTDASSRIRVERPFALALSPVTVAQYAFAAEFSRRHSVSPEWLNLLSLEMPNLARALPSIDTSKLQEAAHPVTDVSWQDARLYCHWLSRITGREYRLPSEAEWALCVQSGTGEVRGSKIEANYDDRFSGSSRGENRFLAGTTPIGQYAPSPLGLFDMRGNVWEWVADAWGSSAVTAPADGSPREDEKPFSDRVLRGGGWESSRETIRLAARRRAPQTYRLTSIGFRVACAL